MVLGCVVSREIRRDQPNPCDHNKWNRSQPVSTHIGDGIRSCARMCYALVRFTILFSYTAHRTQRPWQGAQESPTGTKLALYDSRCYLCPGNMRATGVQNDVYESTFVFENDYAALKPEEHFKQPTGSDIAGKIFAEKPARGRCYVLCFNPRHDLALAQLTTSPFSAETHIVPVVRAWQKLYKDIVAENPFVQYIQFFENKGAAMGCSNPHPHGQVWSLDYVPDEPARELQSQRDFALDPSNADVQGARDAQGRPSLLLEYAYLELSMPDRPRVVSLNEDFVAAVPYWAVWPFELLVLPYRRVIPSIAELKESEVATFAAILGEVTCRYDNLFKTAFPYSMGIHQSPVPGSDETAVLHVHFFPPLLRSATVRKFQVGYVFFVTYLHSFEMMAEPQRDITAESAAARLAACDTVHYLHAS